MRHNKDRKDLTPAQHRQAERDRRARKRAEDLRRGWTFVPNRMLTEKEAERLLCALQATPSQLARIAAEVNR